MLKELCCGEEGTGVPPLAQQGHTDRLVTSFFFVVVVLLRRKEGPESHCGMAWAHGYPRGYPSTQEGSGARMRRRWLPRGVGSELTWASGSLLEFDTHKEPRPGFRFPF